jgi:hypothetical protein
MQTPAQQEVEGAVQETSTGLDATVAPPQAQEDNGELTEESEADIPEDGPAADKSEDGSDE